MSPKSGLWGKKGPPCLLAVMQAPTPQEQLGSRGHFGVYSGTVWPQVLRSSCPYHSAAYRNSSKSCCCCTNTASGAYVPEEGDENPMLGQSLEVSVGAGVG